MMQHLIAGFLPLVDCAALAVAAEMGFAAEQGLDLTLVRETSWANIRDRLITGRFDAAHMLGPMVVAASVGAGHVRTPTIAPMALGLGGNAITVSMALWSRMRDQGAPEAPDPRAQGEALRRVVVEQGKRSKTPLTFGMVYPFSCHNYELRYWLAASGIDPDLDVRLTVLPPSFLTEALQNGQVDGFCVGSPWNSVAVDVGVGRIVTATTAIWRQSPEKVLGMSQRWAESHPDLVAALVRAVYLAARWCEQPGNHDQLAAVLAQPRYVGCSARILRQILAHQFPLAPGSSPSSLPGYACFVDDAATFPWKSHALWFYRQMVRWGQVTASAADEAVAIGSYRPDLYRSAVAPLYVDVPAVDFKVEEGFFDGVPFQPS